MSLCNALTEASKSYFEPRCLDEFPPSFLYRRLLNYDIRPKGSRDIYARERAELFFSFLVLFLINAGKRYAFIFLAKPNPNETASCNHEKESCVSRNRFKLQKPSLAQYLDTRLRM